MTKYFPVHMDKLNIMMEKAPSFQVRIFHIIQKEKWERTFIISIVYGCIWQKAWRRNCGMDMWMDKVDVLLTSLGYSFIFMWLNIASMMHIYVRITMHINNTYKYIWFSFCREVAHMVQLRGENLSPSWDSLYACDSWGDVHQKGLLDDVILDRE